MPTFLGTSPISALKVGDLDVSKVMLGDQQVYSAAAAGPVPTRVGSGEFTGGGNANMVVAAPAGVQVGDWMVAVNECTTSASTTVPAGWTEIVPMTSSGTLRMNVMARKFQVGDTSWDFVLSGPVSRLLGMFIVRGADELNTWVIGTAGRRVDQAATVTTTAAGINAPAGSLVVTCASERTTATGDTVSPSGATLWGYSFGGGVESVGAFYRECPSAETTPPVVLTYNNVQSSNGLAVQIAIPAPEEAPFSPFDIDWADLYWASGPTFSALGLGDGNGVNPWPSEVGGVTAPLNAGTAPLHVSADATFNNKPVVSSMAAVTYLLRTAAPALTTPYTLVFIGVRIGGNSSPSYMGAKDGAAANAGLTHTGLSAGLTLAHTQTNVPHLLEGYVNLTASEVYINGVLNATGDTSTNPANTQRALFARASVPTAPLTGKIAFAGFLNRGLTTQERADLTTWARDFYALA